MKYIQMLMNNKSIYISLRQKTFDTARIRRFFSIRVAIGDQDQ